MYDSVLAERSSRVSLYLASFPSSAHVIVSENDSPLCPIGWLCYIIGNMCNNFRYI